MKLVQQYINLNQSFKKNLVFHLGAEAGFFSEYNNMILAVLYCLKHKIKFELYSIDAVFGYEKGWQDYFLPFCEEITDSRHSKFNPRQPVINSSYRRNFKIFFFKFTSGITYLTADLWNSFHNKNFENLYFNLPDLGITGYTREVCNKLIKLTWRFNDQTKTKINELINNLNLPQKYIGVHIRRGDKNIEYNDQDIKLYMNAISKISTLKDIFFSTDDYRVIFEIRNNYKDFNIFSLCPDNRFGYFHDDFKLLEDKEKRKEMIELFASIEILSRSEHFIGTFSSNIVMYLGLRMNKESIHSIFDEKWTIW